MAAKKSRKKAVEGYIDDSSVRPPCSAVAEAWEDVEKKLNKFKDRGLISNTLKAGPTTTDQVVKSFKKGLAELHTQGAEPVLSVPIVTGGPAVMGKEYWDTANEIADCLPWIPAQDSIIEDEADGERKGKEPRGKFYMIQMTEVDDPSFLSRCFRYDANMENCELYALVDEETFLKETKSDLSCAVQRMGDIVRWVERVTATESEFVRKRIETASHITYHKDKLRKEKFESPSVIAVYKGNRVLSTSVSDEEDKPYKTQITRDHLLDALSIHKELILTGFERRLSDTRDLVGELLGSVEETSSGKYPLVSETGLMVRKNIVKYDGQIYGHPEYVMILDPEKAAKIIRNRKSREKNGTRAGERRKKDDSKLYAKEIVNMDWQLRRIVMDLFETDYIRGGYTTLATMAMSIQRLECISVLIPFIVTINDEGKIRPVACTWMASMRDFLQTIDPEAYITGSIRRRIKAVRKLRDDVVELKKKRSQKDGFEMTSRSIDLEASHRKLKNLIQTRRRMIKLHAIVKKVLRKAETRAAKLTKEYENERKRKKRARKGKKNIKKKAKR